MARILLVEDNSDMRPLVERILQYEGHKATATDRVAIAMSLLESQRFDLVICDVILPDGSGLIVADKAIAAGIKALVVTGHGLSLKPGSLAQYDYLLKPVSVADLLGAIERCLVTEGGQVIRFPKPAT